MRLVTDGENYSIRWGIWPFHMFFDLDTPGYWWTKWDRYYTSCWTKDRAYAEKWMGALKPKKVKRVID